MARGPAPPRPHRAPEPQKKPRLVSFEGRITLGQVFLFLPLLGLLWTGIGTIWQVSGEYQQMRDQIAHEGELRQQAIAALTQEVRTLAQQQAHDILSLQTSLGDLRSDIRAWDRNSR